MAVVDIVAMWFVVACRQKGMYRFVKKKVCVVGVVLVVFQVVCLLCCMSFPDVNVCSFFEAPAFLAQSILVWP